MSSIKVTPSELLRFCQEALTAVGVPAADAQVTAESLVFANLRGVDSHGVIRLKVYTQRVRAGGFRAGAGVLTVSDQPATAVLDARHGLGQPAAQAAMRLAMHKAAANGLGLVTVRNSNHFGACAFYALQALDEGMIGFAATNAGPTMAPSGGREARLGNNAMALALPAGSAPPVVLDMATGAVAWGKIFVAQQEKRSIPATWALDKHGVPTTDPNAAAQQGLIQPFGGYKGYGLSLLIDMVTGVLSGGGFSTGVRTLYQQLEAPAEVAHTLAALRVDAFMPLTEFHERVQSILALMHACPLAPGAERIWVPGEIEHETEQARRAAGIPLNAELAAELRALAQELKLAPPC